MTFGPKYFQTLVDQFDNLIVIPQYLTMSRKNLKTTRSQLVMIWNEMDLFVENTDHDEQDG
jgi:hypothetical protein